MSHIGKKRKSAQKPPKWRSWTGKKSRVYLRTAVSKYIVSKNAINCNTFFKYLSKKRRILFFCVKCQEYLFRRAQNLIDIPKII